MQFISSTLVEFEQPDLIPVESGKLLAQMRKMQAFYYELYDSYLRGGKYIVRYMFYTLSAVKRVTRAQIRKQFAAISRKAESVLPEDMQALREEAGKKEIVLYTDGSFSQEEHSGTSVRQDCHNPYRSSRKPKPAPCPSSRKPSSMPSAKTPFSCWHITPNCSAGPSSTRLWKNTRFLCEASHSPGCAAETSNSCRR